VDTLTFEDFHLFSCQAVLFTPDEEVSSAKLLKGLLPQTRWAERFDADPVALPSPAAVVSVGPGIGTPREIPKIILQSKEPGIWRCQIASERINFYWQKQRSETPETTLVEFFSEASSFLCEYREFLRARVGRLAAILMRYAPHSSPGLFLAQHFCKDQLLEKPFDRPIDFELHAHKRYTLTGKFSINSWVRNKTGQLLASGERTSVLFVEQDLNTLSEETQKRDFTNEEIQDFFSTAATELYVWHTKMWIWKAAKMAGAACPTLKWQDRKTVGRAVPAIKLARLQHNSRSWCTAHIDTILQLYYPKRG
jgi:hypothetical protein